MLCDYLVATEVFSWGSGVNYQLGTGNAHIQKLPCKVDSLHGSFIKLVSAAKFHSVAVSARGEVYTWGFGRGGRLGHPDFDIHRLKTILVPLFGHICDKFEIKEFKVNISIWFQLSSNFKKLTFILLWNQPSLAYIF